MSKLLPNPNLQVIESGETERAFDHVLLIMFENQYRGYVMANPYMRRLAKQGIQLQNFFGVMHPSQTNYIASTAAELCNVTSDDRPTPTLSQRTIVDLIEEAPGSLRWKGYMESYVAEAAPWQPDNYVPQDASPYLIKHNPYSSFTSIIQNQERWKRIENDAAFFADILNGELPEYAWYTPNIWSDGHWVDGTQDDVQPRAPILVDQLAKWLEGFFNRLRFPGPDSHLPPRTMVVVTFDESDFESEPDIVSSYDGPNQIYTVLLGDCIQPGYEEEGYNHYSLMRTIEKNFGLGSLGKNDARANWFQFLWDRRFEWSAPKETPFTGDVDGPLCGADFGGSLYVASAASDGTVRVRVRVTERESWSAETTLQLDGSGGLAMASTFFELVLLARSATGELQCMRYDLPNGWTTEVSPTDGAVQSFALASFAGYTKLMFTYADQDGNVSSRIRSGSDYGVAGVWEEAVAVPAAQTDGGMTLGVQSESLYLIVKAPGAQSMNMISYNVAPFNVVTVPTNPYGGAQDNTTVNAWSPSVFPVAHFSARPDTTGQLQPLARPYETTGPMAVATLDGVMHLTHPGVGNPLLMTETFSIAGVMTPSQPVSYKSSNSATASNGFGTLAEAGWSKQSPLFDAECRPGGAIAMSRVGKEIVLLHRASPTAPVLLQVGRYVRSDARRTNV
ncbi:MAG: alkaline phosphatase family protein [Candidatus Kapaibacterium sp.]